MSHQHGGTDAPECTTCEGRKPDLTPGTRVKFDYGSMHVEGFVADQTARSSFLCIDTEDGRNKPFEPTRITNLTVLAPPPMTEPEELGTRVQCDGDGVWIATHVNMDGNIVWTHVGTGNYCLWDYLKNPRPLPTAPDAAAIRAQVLAEVEAAIFKVPLTTHTSGSYGGWLTARNEIVRAVRALGGAQ